MASPLLRFASLHFTSHTQSHRRTSADSADLNSHVSHLQGGNGDSGGHDEAELSLVASGTAVGDIGGGGRGRSSRLGRGGDLSGGGSRGGQRLGGHGDRGGLDSAGGLRRAGGLGLAGSSTGGGAGGRAAGGGARGGSSAAGGGRAGGRGAALNGELLGEVVVGLRVVVAVVDNAESVVGRGKVLGDGDGDGVARSVGSQSSNRLQGVGRAGLQGDGAAAVTARVLDGELIASLDVLEVAGVVKELGRGHDEGGRGQDSKGGGLHLDGG
jgi:hypothetical protein